MYSYASGFSLVEQNDNIEMRSDEQSETFEKYTSNNCSNNVGVSLDVRVGCDLFECKSRTGISYAVHYCFLTLTQIRCPRDIVIAKYQKQINNVPT